jgi:hypothetical protein
MLAAQLWGPPLFHLQAEHRLQEQQRQQPRQQQ